MAAGSGPAEPDPARPAGSTPHAEQKGFVSGLKALRQSSSPSRQHRSPRLRRHDASPHAFRQHRQADRSLTNPNGFQRSTACQSWTALGRASVRTSTYSSPIPGQIWPRKRAVRCRTRFGPASTRVDAAFSACTTSFLVCSNWRRNRLWCPRNTPTD